MREEGGKGGGMKSGTIFFAWSSVPRTYDNYLLLAFTGYIPFLKAAKESSF